MLGVVIPAYERKKHLKEALESLCQQTYKSFVAIVIDDHSSEPLKPVVDQFRDRLHIIYRYLEKNGGPGVARQTGLNLCYEKGYDYVCFLDSDDKLFPQALARLAHEVKLNNFDMVTSRIWLENPGGSTGSELPETNNTWLHGKIYKTDFLKTNNICFSAARLNEDIAFNLKVAGISSRIGRLRECLYFFSNETNSLTNTKNLKMACYSTTFIEAIYDATTFLQQRNILTHQLITDIISCYNKYQLASITGLVTEELKEQIKFLLNLPEVKKNILVPSKFAQFAHVLCQAQVIDDQVYYFVQTFYEWIKEFINEDSNN